MSVPSLYFLTQIENLAKEKFREFELRAQALAKQGWLIEHRMEMGFYNLDAVWVAEKFPNAKKRFFVYFKTYKIPACAYIAKGWLKEINVEEYEIIADLIIEKEEGKRERTLLLRDRKTGKLFFGSADKGWQVWEKKDEPTEIPAPFKEYKLFVKLRGLKEEIELTVDKLQGTLFWDVYRKLVDKVDRMERQAVAIKKALEKLKRRDEE